MNKHGVGICLALDQETGAVVVASCSKTSQVGLFFFFFLSLFSFLFLLLPPQMFNCAKHIQLILHTLILLFFFFLLLVFNTQKTLFHTLQQLVPVQCPSVVGFRLHSIDDRLVGRNHSTIESIENSVGGVLLTLRMQ